MNFKNKGIKEFSITDLRMTRFWITLEQGVDLVIKALEESQGGEIFIPKIPSMKITDLARAIEPKCTFKAIGIRPGEKIHETLVSEDEARNTKEFGDAYVILSAFYTSEALEEKYAGCTAVAENFCYRSDTNEEWLTLERLQEMFNPQDWTGKNVEYSIR